VFTGSRSTLTAGETEGVPGGIRGRRLQAGRDGNPRKLATVDPTLVLLARHGESDWNAAGRFQGHADRPLTARGREQAARLADRLACVPLDAVYASDLRRAWETAAIAARPHGLEVEKLPELREVNVGSWSGLSREEARRRFPEGYRRWLEWDVGWDDGETYEQLGERVVGAVRRLALRHPAGRLLVISHGGSLRALRAAAAGVDTQTYRREHPVTPNADLSALLVGSDGRLSEASGHNLD
jgi:broad specificity phosphatase PhoE